MSRFALGPRWSSLRDVTTATTVRPLGCRTMTWGGDGRRLLMIRRDGQSGGNASQVTVVLNWFEELKRLVPIP